MISRRNKICLIPILEGQLKYTAHCQSSSPTEGLLGLRFGTISGNSQELKLLWTVAYMLGYVLFQPISLHFSVLIPEFLPFLSIS